MGRMKMTRQAEAMAVVGLIAATGGALGLAGCLQILGDDGTFIAAGGSTATGGGGSGTTSAGTGGTTSAPGCEPGVSEDCYSGPDGTQDVGICKPGTRTCLDGESWSVCTGDVVPAKETCITDTDEDCDQRECALWSWMASCSGDSVALAIDADSKGNSIVFGSFTGTLTLGGTTLDQMNGGPLFVARFDTAGNALWAKNFGGTDPQFTVVGDSLAIDANDNIYVGLNFTGHLEINSSSFDADGQDFCIVKYTPTGVKAWNQKYGGPSDQTLWEIVVDDSSVVHAAGSFALNLNIGGGLVNGTGIFLARLSGSSGSPTNSTTHLDSVQFGQPRIAKGPNNTVGLAGQCPATATIGGKTLNPCGYFVAKLDANHTALWAVPLPQRPNDIVMDSAGNVLVTSDFQNTITMGGTTLQSKGGWDMMVSKLAAADGSVVWAKSWGGTGDDELAQLSIDGQDRFYLSVDAQDTIDFGGSTLEAAGLGDTFVAAFGAGGAHRWSRVFGNATAQGGKIVARLDNGGPLVLINTAGDLDFGAGLLHADSPQFALALLAP